MLSSSTRFDRQVLLCLLHCLIGTPPEASSTQYYCTQIISIMAEEQQEAVAMDVDAKNELEQVPEAEEPAAEGETAAEQPASSKKPKAKKAPTPKQPAEEAPAGRAKRERKSVNLYVPPVNVREKKSEKPKEVGHSIISQCAVRTLRGSTSGAVFCTSSTCFRCRRLCSWLCLMVQLAQQRAVKQPACPCMGTAVLRPVVVMSTVVLLLSVFRGRVRSWVKSPTVSALC